MPELSAGLPWEAAQGDLMASQSTPGPGVAAALPRYSVPELVAAASQSSRRSDDEGTDSGLPAQLLLCGQLTSRRKLAKDLIFFDLKDPSIAAAKMAASTTPVVHAEEPACEAVELVLSGREVDADTIEVGRALRLGDCIEVICALEPSDRATRSGKPSPGVAVQAQLPATAGIARRCIQVQHSAHRYTKV